MKRGMTFVVFVLAVFLVLPAGFAADGGGSSGSMMGGGMMGRGMMGHGMSMKKMAEHHRAMGDLLKMFKKSLVILERTKGVSATDRAELEKMIKRVGEIIETHRSMMKEMMKGMKGMKGMKDGHMKE